MQPNKLFYPNGSLYADISENERRYFYEDGQRKTCESYQNGRLHGEVTLYWQKGHLKRRSHFCNGVRHGLDEIWREDGQLADRGSFELGVAIGVHRRWNALGDLIEEIEYIDSLKYNFRSWDESGKLLFESIWEKDSYFEKTWDAKAMQWLEKKGHLNGKKITYV